MCIVYFFRLNTYNYVPSFFHRRKKIIVVADKTAVFANMCAQFCNVKYFLYGTIISSPTTPNSAQTNVQGGEYFPKIFVANYYSTYHINVILRQNFFSRLLHTMSMAKTFLKIIMYL